MRVLAIDPGTEKGAVVALTVTAVNKAPVIDNVCMMESEAIADLIHESRYDVIICERIARGGMADKNVLQTAEWVGAYRENARQTKQPFVFMLRSTVKSVLKVTGKNTDPKVRDVLLAKYATTMRNHGKGTKDNKGYFYSFNSHCFQAFALYDTWLTKEGYALLMGKAA